MGGPGDVSAGPGFSSKQEDSVTDETRETIAFLNRLLEAERAGVKVLARLIPDIRNETVAELARSFLRDEGMNCQVLKTMIENMRGTVSPAVGDFVEKVEALSSMEEKLDLLVRGQEWVARQIRKNRSMALTAPDRLFLESIKVQHEHNVDALKDALNG